MFRLAAIRLLAAVPVLMVVSLVSFGLTLLVPGDMAAEMAGPSATAADLARIRGELGLDRPPLVRMASWYSGLLHGDLGRSVLLNQGVTEAILERLPVTLSLTCLALGLACLAGIPAGLVAAAKARRWPDQAAMGAALVGLSLPDFWLGLVLIWVLGVKLNLMPTGGYVALSADAVGWLRSITLPAGALALTQLGPIARMTRSAALEVADSDFIRTARAKGLTEPRVYARHVLSGALVPILTVVGIGFGLSLGGALVIEQVFSLPGVGRLVIGAVLRRDWPVIQGGLLLTALVFVMVNLIVDLLYLWVDPRLRSNA
ncbi:ABC transporter permease [Limobrevibacterium gyesilva]|uniref:ABC transporter permease n=1 Tax=Limobrevibacterium gyesilva TaxID=2991712 RepID=A0AA41YRJ4_9PROT|nr:ABC transporter permease [Limobrevibacterium gyesilva]MCW3477247.1 ABC transporter permease [Limobrevibacterium gyesilva]